MSSAAQLTQCFAKKLPVMTSRYLLWDSTYLLTPVMMFLAAAWAGTRARHSFHHFHGSPGWTSWCHVNMISWTNMRVTYRWNCVQALTEPMVPSSKFVLNLSEGLSWSPGPPQPAPWHQYKAWRDPLQQEYQGCQYENFHGQKLKTKPLDWTFFKFFAL